MKHQPHGAPFVTPFFPFLAQLGWIDPWESPGSDGGAGCSLLSLFRRDQMSLFRSKLPLDQLNLVGCQIWIGYTDPCKICFLLFIPEQKISHVNIYIYKILSICTSSLKHLMISPLPWYLPGGPFRSRRLGPSAAKRRWSFGAEIVEQHLAPIVFFGSLVVHFWHHMVHWTEAVFCMALTNTTLKMTWLIYFSIVFTHGLWLLASSLPWFSTRKVQRTYYERTWQAKGHMIFDQPFGSIYCTRIVSGC